MLAKQARNMLPDFATRNRAVLAIVTHLILAAASLPAQTTAFTYQGRLQEGAQPADGSYDLQFSLADACSNGNYVATSLTCAAVPVSNGLFAVTLDFGGGVFDGSPRWLEVGVRTNGSSDPYTLLSPRQAITAAPYAMFAGGLAPGALITADGAGITNLNGAFIQAGTINSNQLDQATAAQLSLGGGQPARLTNAVLMDGSLGTNIYCLVTNAHGPYGASSAFDDQFALWFPAGKNTNLVRLTFSQANPSVNTEIMYWPKHNSSGTPELILNAAPGSLCFYYDHIQWGQPSHRGPTYEYWKSSLYSGQLDRETAFTNFWMWPGATWCFQALVRTNTGSNDVRMAGSLGASSGNIRMPAMQFRPTSTNGSAAWIWMDDFEPAARKTSVQVTPWGTNTHSFFADNSYIERFRITAGPDGGVSFKGKLTVNGAVGITTNYTLTTGDVMSISNGIIVGLGPPPPYVWHEAATNYLARINTELSTSLATNINQFVADVTPSGVLTNLDACYLFPGDEGANAQNLLSTNYTLTYSGTFVSNDATGLQGDGSGYADTHWVNSQVNSGTLWFYRSKNGTIPSATTYVGVFGARDNEDITGMYLVSTDSQWHGGLNGAKWGGTVGIVTNAAPGSICLVRAGTNQCYVYTNGATTPYISSATASSAVPANSVWLLGMNNTGGNTFNSWDGKLQGFVVGTNAISGAQCAALYSAMTNFNARMGR